MHELSIAMSIIEMAEEESEKRGVRVEAIHLRLGPLAGVVKEALVSAYGLACEGTAVAGSKLVVEDMPIIVFCPNCRERRTIESMQLFCCPDCGTPTPEVLQGSELEIFALEVSGP